MKKFTGKKEMNRINIIRPKNAYFLVIVESPSKCSKIESYLGEQYQCIASRGHIREINGLKSIDIKNNFKPTFQLIEDKCEWITSMRSVISQYPKNRVILATDNDREGEAIAYHICQVFDLPVETTMRIIFTEITKNAILNAIKNPIKINRALVDAQHARQILDIIIGFKISPLLWKYLYHSKTASLSAGRVQTPVLRLIYDNHKKNADIKTADPTYKTSAYFFQENLKFDLSREHATKGGVETFLEKSKDFDYRPTLGEKNTSIRAPPNPLNTSRLLQIANNTLRYSPKQTMQYAQELYQGGYITYMRTENTKYSAEFLKSARGYINDKFGKDQYLGDLNILENTDKNNPHEAVRVTNLNISTLDASCKSALPLYKLIWRITLESCMSAAQYNTYKIIVSAPEGLTYSHLLEIPIFLGWKAVVEGNGLAEHLANMSGILFHMQTAIGVKIAPKWIESKIVLHNNHHYYGESTIIQKMEELGIGRPSTYAMMVDTIQERGYVKCQDLGGITIQCEEYILRGSVLEKTTIERIFGNEKNKLVISPMGIICIEFLIQHFDTLFAYEYTKTMEEDLDKIASDSDVHWYSMCDKYYNDVVDKIKPVAKVHKESYRIDELHQLQFQVHGPVVKRTNTDGGFEYLPVKKTIQIDIDRLKRGEYHLADLVEFKMSFLGKYQDIDVYLKVGEYGPYLSWGDQKTSLRDIEISLNEIDLEKAIIFLQEGSIEKADASTVIPATSIIRKINDDYSVRRGKYGPYIYYKTAKMKTPKFTSLAKFPDDYMTCNADILEKWTKAQIE